MENRFRAIAIPGSVGILLRYVGLPEATRFLLSAELVSSCQVPRCFLSISLAQLETAWCTNPKGRTGQLVPTQNDFYLYLFVWSGWLI